MKSTLLVQLDSEYLTYINLIWSTWYHQINQFDPINLIQLNLSTMFDQIDLIDLLWSTWSRLQPKIALSKSAQLKHDSKHSFQIWCLDGKLAWAWLSSAPACLGVKRLFMRVKIKILATISAILKNSEDSVCASASFLMSGMKTQFFIS